ncbi:protease [Siccirubricoccus sp. KC 17139]|uniref:Protease n=1 Tax=Siccirubricoccus soli TaxID=2899147 RepID=A0ABT1DBR8_9PROT|nr:protease [Siccirubricoccus soli]MCO6419027.1 protease [Siccirubricoccus soli]MCP2685162.1 protease [Siccirubricoccus soli]
MIELMLILFGAEVARRKAVLLGLAGLGWMLLGAFFFVNAFTEDARIPALYFALPLMLDGGLSLVAAYGSKGAGRSLRYSKALAFLLIAGLIIAMPRGGGMIIGFLVGSFLVADAVWRATSAHLVRFRRWRRTVCIAGIEFLLGLWSFLPWPSYWQGEVGSDVGLLLMVSAWRICALAWRLVRLPPGAPMSRIVAEGLLRAGAGPAIARATAEQGGLPGEHRRIPVTVHVWTPTGELASIDRSISRYIAARDERGVISTGHAALEAGELYISHYPAVEIERSGADFRRTLRATQDNDVPGRFLPSYAEESAGWCASTRQVTIPGIDAAALHRFWAHYGADATYNLTSRNCSSSVAAALDAGLEGIFAPYSGSPYCVLRLLFSPELWIAAQLRATAGSMAWTPGIVLDYARALSYIAGLPGRLGWREAARRE